ncbi:MAG: hypothetical protein HPY90_11760 [Syntrophothermus sp.]|uniref:hypothetical protein n=1 Tax=Syntrophothermus sp. TaxID=2736299 RepID=UPI00257D721D|nr:hypothetical protein [Syntrophothermus sp.]NSW83923.1 hypothetical protein [Syntrophothermus sp.]
MVKNNSQAVRLIGTYVTMFKPASENTRPSSIMKADRSGAITRRAQVSHSKKKTK